MKLAENGCNIAVVDVNLKAAEQTVNEIKLKGLKAKAYKVDVTKSEEILKLRQCLFDDLGPVDILVRRACSKRAIQMKTKTFRSTTLV